MTGTNCDLFTHKYLNHLVVVEETDSKDENGKYTLQRLFLRRGWGCRWNGLGIVSKKILYS
jgi:hypothetical protein